MPIDARFAPISYEDYDEFDLTACDTCRYRYGECWSAGRCLMEDY